MSDNIQPSNPPASTICTIQAIVANPSRYKDRKIRFLGWYDPFVDFPDLSVDTYDIPSSIVTLAHSGQRVQVDVSILVDDLRFNLGEWMNVIGYLEKDDEEWMVKGIMVWPVTPGFNLIHYENTVNSRMETTI